jgi:hypothetical protein
MKDRKKWEYHVIHLNLEKNSDNATPNPTIASNKFKGALSSEFIKKEFPKNYKTPPKPLHPAAQLANFFNKLGSEGWEFTETFELDKMLMLVFRRELLSETKKEIETKKES